MFKNRKIASCKRLSMYELECIDILFSSHRKSFCNAMRKSIQSNTTSAACHRGASLSLEREGLAVQAFVIRSRRLENLNSGELNPVGLDIMVQLCSYILCLPNSLYSPRLKLRLRLVALPPQPSNSPTTYLRILIHHVIHNPLGYNSGHTTDPGYIQLLRPEHHDLTEDQRRD